MKSMSLRGVGSLALLIVEDFVVCFDLGGIFVETLRFERPIGEQSEEFEELEERNYGSVLVHFIW